MAEMLTQLGSAIAGLMVIWAMFQEYFPYHLRGNVEKYVHKIVSFFYPYIQISIDEYAGDWFKRSEAYADVETYLSAYSSTKAKRLKAEIVKSSQSLGLSMDDHEEITDEFEGIKIWWASNKFSPKTQSISFFPASNEKKFYKLTFHQRNRETITKRYLDYVLKEGKEIAMKNRQRKLYTNNSKDDWHGYKSTKWSHVAFEHPATFETLALEPEIKEDIMSDLITFSQGKEYYKKIGKPWKRGYLLHGPPGTGKSTMIAAMANLLSYDIYDLELTAVKDNTELRKLLIETTSKSIIVIEDIDCSLDLTGQRAKKEKDDDDDKEKDKVEKIIKEHDENKSKVTLSGLLNFIDGLWSACGGERLIVFTTNYVEKLDPALIRRGRMDKHIELSYCGFKAFKVLARNYLDVEDHPLFKKIRSLFDETKITPADVAENLMRKTIPGNVDICLKNLVQALEKAKKEAMLKAEEEARLKAKEEATMKSEKEAKEKGVSADDVAKGEKAKEEKPSPEDEVKENGVNGSKEG